MAQARFAGDDLWRARCVSPTESMGRSLLLLLALVASAAGLQVGGALAARPARVRAASPVTMGNNAPDGPFTPVVKLGKLVLGDQLLNKVRGKAITIHSQLITEFCQDYGVQPKTRGGLIKKAKNVGAALGFLS